MWWSRVQGPSSCGVLAVPVLRPGLLPGEISARDRKVESHQHSIHSKLTRGPLPSRRMTQRSSSSSSNSCTRATTESMEVQSLGSRLSMSHRRPPQARLERRGRRARLRQRICTRSSGNGPKRTTPMTKTTRQTTPRRTNSTSPTSISRMNFSRTGSRSNASRKP